MPAADKFSFTEMPARTRATQGRPARGGQSPGDDEKRQLQEVFEKGDDHPVLGFASKEPAESLSPIPELSIRPKSRLELFPAAVYDAIEHHPALLIGKDFRRVRLGVFDDLFIC